MKEIYLLLGSNRGDRLSLIEQAKTMIALNCGSILTTSSLYETEPWGFEDATPFLNQVVEIDSVLEPEILMNQLLAIEEKLGREREGRRQKAESNSQFSILNSQFVSRTIDLDILFFANKIVSAPDLVIPHPRLHERRFTLEPLHEITPTFQHPVLKKTISLLLQQCTDTHKVVRIS